jgi:hypothetical protein
MPLQISRSLSIPALSANLALRAQFMTTIADHTWSFRHDRSAIPSRNQPSAGLQARYTTVPAATAPTGTAAARSAGPAAPVIPALVKEAMKPPAGQAAPQMIDWPSAAAETSVVSSARTAENEEEVIRLVMPRPPKPRIGRMLAVTAPAATPAAPAPAATVSSG